MHGDALAIRREIGDKGGVAQSLLNIGTILYREGDLAGAKHSYQESVSIGREIADRSQISIGLHNLAGVLIEQGDLVGAKRTLDEALAMRRQIDRKSTRLNSSHVRISYAVFCLKKTKTAHEAV